jgi:gamma-glutamyltranspeptidase/glutathione hydrolase
LKILADMGYNVKEQTTWGATEMILVGLPGGAGVNPEGSGNDSGVSGQVRPGFIYGANDSRRPAGSAAGY